MPAKVLGGFICILVIRFWKFDQIKEYIIYIYIYINISLVYQENPLFLTVYFIDRHVGWNESVIIDSVFWFGVLFLKTLFKKGSSK